MQPLNAIREFLALESAGGILLGVAAIAAMVFANSPADHLYIDFLETPVALRVGELGLAKPLLVWINDGLMAVFCLLVGLELKREILDGELSEPSQVALPAIAAAGGMAVPALFYAFFNWDNPETLKGWAIPAATDIAFSLGILELLGTRVPTGLKVFLMTLAILDDTGAIIIIAVFHSEHLSTRSLPVTFLMLLLLLLMNLCNVKRVAPFVLAGLVLWASVLRSGVHATLAGIALAMFIPQRVARRMEHDLHPPVAYGILPLFAFANAGVSLQGVTPDEVFKPVSMGIMVGLVIGKPIGVFCSVGLTVLSGVANLPRGADWWGVFGVSALCGIGFTMSLCVAQLAFEGDGESYGVQTRLGILSGSIVSAVLGYVILNFTLPKDVEHTSD